MAEIRQIAAGLMFPAGPVALPDGSVLVVEIAGGRLSRVTPDRQNVEHVPMPDHGTTNICFGGPELKTAYITLGTTGRLVAMDWPRPGLLLNFLNKQNAHSDLQP